MAITRQLTNGNKLTDWTPEVNDIANQYGLVNGSGLFSGQGTSQTSLVFDKTSNVISLLGQTKRNGGPATKGNDRKVETFRLALPYFLHQDYVTPQDIQGHRMAGTPDSPETLANVIATKLEDMRMTADQTREFMKIEAIKGITTDADGIEIADMFDKLGITYGLNAGDGDLQNIDFDLGTPASDPDAAIAKLKRSISKNAKMGGRIGKIEVMVSPSFFDALVTHPLLREAYLHYQVSNSRSDVVRGDLARFESWGVVDTFEHKGILFYSYDAEFLLEEEGSQAYTTRVALGVKSTVDAESRDNGRLDASYQALETEETARVGYTCVKGMRNLYQGYFGPANNLSGANGVGSEIMVYQYTDQKDKFHEMELEMANLYYINRPQMSVRVFSST
jgi:hypothetical protein